MKFTNRAKDGNTKIELFCSVCLFGYLFIIFFLIVKAVSIGPDKKRNMNGFPGTLSSSPFVSVRFSVNALTVRENKPITEL